jgi:hypothetical protein
MMSKSEKHRNPHWASRIGYQETFLSQRASMTHFRHGTLLALALYALVPIGAADADQVFPPGTECANLRTIAERLLCGRQELKRGDAAVQQQQNVPPPPYDGWSPDPDQAQPPPSGTGTAPNTPATQSDPNGQPISPQP